MTGKISGGRGRGRSREMMVDGIRCGVISMEFIPSVRSVEGHILQGHLAGCMIMSDDFRALQC